MCNRPITSKELMKNEKHKKRMELFETLKKRHMTRSFKTDPLSSETITKLVYAGTRAPTGANLDYRVFLVVDNFETIKMLKSMSPGFPGPPPLIIAILTDVE